METRLEAEGKTSFCNPLLLQPYPPSENINENGREPIPMKSIGISIVFAVYESTYLILFNFYDDSMTQMAWKPRSGDKGYQHY